MARHRGTNRHYPGRHRYGLPGLVHCIYFPAVQLRMAWRRAGWLPTRHDLSGATRRTPLSTPTITSTASSATAVPAGTLPVGTAPQHWSTGSDRLAA